MRRLTALSLAVLLLLSACGGNSAGTWQEQYDLGVRYLSEGNYEEAVIAFTAAIDIDPKQALSYVGRGRAYILSDDSEDSLDAARADFEEALELDDSLADAWIGLADVYIAGGDYQRALSVLEEGGEIIGENDDIAERLEQVREALYVDAARYSISQQDLSYYNENGQALILLTYELLELKGDSPAFEAINEDLYQKYEAFYAAEGGREGFAQFLDNPYLTPEFPYEDTAVVTVTHNKDGVLSIREDTYWFMGGVGNANYKGMTYDLNSGRELGLTDLLDMDETSLVTLLREITLDFVLNSYENGYMTFEETPAAVARFTLPDFSFYVDNGQIILIFDTYVLGPGAAGPAEIPTGLFIGQDTAGQGDGGMAAVLGYAATAEESAWHAYEMDPGDGSAYIAMFSCGKDGSGSFYFAIYRSDVFFSTGSCTLNGDRLRLDMDTGGTRKTAEYTVSCVGRDAVILTQVSNEGCFYKHMPGHQLALIKGVY